MSALHLLLALSVVVIWGMNFLFIHYGLNQFSPELLCALRFLLASVPFVFFIKPPSPFKGVLLYGLFTFALQFSLLFLGMKIGMTPGLASLLIQTQVFFSIFSAAIFLGESPSLYQILGAFVSFCGMGLIALHFDSHAISLLGFLLVLAAAGSWGIGNLIIKKMGHVNMISLVLWGSFVAFFPLFFLSLYMDGISNIVNSVTNASWLSLNSVFYIAYISTWIGYGLWNWLLTRYSVAIVAPFTLLVPVVGMLSSAVVLGEPLQSWKLIAGCFVILGLCINLFGAKLVNAYSLAVLAKANRSPSKERPYQ